MGATGTGKSAFIRLLTDDDYIHIGHNPESKTSDIQTAFYVDQMTGSRVMLVDTPGFDDSREGEVTDTHILEKTVQFLQPEGNKERMLNGIIYMHRISDPRVGGVARKNLKMFHSLCGDANLKNVCIATTNWNRVSEQEGTTREAALKTNAFKALIDGGAGLRRHTNTVESAQQIVSELIGLNPVTMQIQEELRMGMTLGDTSAGTILIAGMREMQKKHEKELAGLKREMEEATRATDLALRAELAEEHQALELKMTRAKDERKRLERAIVETRENQADEQTELCRQNTTGVTETANVFQDTSETQRLDTESGATGDARRGCPKCEQRLAGRGPVGQFVGEVGEIINDSMRVGERHLGTAGELAGFAIGISTAPLVVTARKFFFSR
ncbi:hypothetical protein JVT61DRAFT_9989 [Boletus reticuloceps]|uniref:G domain-containing protein n=1 Tax=Boletus reticuloceps TaxID=495285 RepID=A0A8I2YYV9_9AGAM|nr:hypothetical protein JVT61DRAFT_9989 [Boletus reticuloceps]